MQNKQVQNKQDKRKKSKKQPKVSIPDLKPAKDAKGGSYIASGDVMIRRGQ